MIRVKLGIILLMIPCMFVIGIRSGQPAWAAMAELSISQLADNSLDIVKADVKSMNSYWNESRDFIFTDVILRVVESFKGAIPVSSEVTITVPGGEVGEVGLKVEHAPEFEAGEVVYAFLSPTENSSYRITGWEQGKYTVVGGQIREIRIPENLFRNQISEALK
jgi:hypothetical protein